MVALHPPGLGQAHPFWQLSGLRTEEATQLVGKVTSLAPLHSVPARLLKIGCESPLKEGRGAGGRAKPACRGQQHVRAGRGNGPDPLRPLDGPRHAAGRKGRAGPAHPWAVEPEPCRTQAAAWNLLRRAARSSRQTHRWEEVRCSPVRPPAAAAGVNLNEAAAKRPCPRHSDSPLGPKLGRPRAGGSELAEQDSRSSLLTQGHAGAASSQRLPAPRQGGVG